MSSVLTHSSDNLTVSGQASNSNVSIKSQDQTDVIKGRRSGLDTAMLLLALSVSVLASFAFALFTVASVVATISAGASGVGAAGIVPGALSTLLFGSMCAASIALSVYTFRKL